MAPWSSPAWVAGSSAPFLATAAAGTRPTAARLRPRAMERVLNMVRLPLDRVLQDDAMVGRGRSGSQWDLGRIDARTGGATSWGRAPACQQAADDERGGSAAAAHRLRGGGGSCSPPPRGGGGGGGGGCFGAAP